MNLKGNLYTFTMSNGNRPSAECIIFFGPSFMIPPSFMESGWYFLCNLQSPDLRQRHFTNITFFKSFNGRARKYNGFFLGSCCTPPPCFGENRPSCYWVVLLTDGYKTYMKEDLTKGSDSVDQCAEWMSIFCGPIRSALCRRRTPRRCTPWNTWTNWNVWSGTRCGTSWKSCRSCRTWSILSWSTSGKTTTICLSLSINSFVSLFAVHDEQCFRGEILCRTMSLISTSASSQTTRASHWLSPSAITIWVILKCTLGISAVMVSCPLHQSKLRQRDTEH